MKHIIFSTYLLTTSILTFGMETNNRIITLYNSNLPEVYIDTIIYNSTGEVIDSIDTQSLKKGQEMQCIIYDPIRQQIHTPIILVTNAIPQHIVLHVSHDATIQYDDTIAINQEGPNIELVSKALIKKIGCFYNSDDPIIIGKKNNNAILSSNSKRLIFHNQNLFQVIVKHIEFCKASTDCENIFISDEDQKFQLPYKSEQIEETILEYDLLVKKLELILKTDECATLHASRSHNDTKITDILIELSTPHAAQKFILNIDENILHSDDTITIFCSEEENKVFLTNQNGHILGSAFNSNITANEFHIR